MSQPKIEFDGPVAWPANRPREGGRKPALFRDGGRQILFDAAVGRLREQLDMMIDGQRRYRALERTLSTNYQLRVDGRPRRDRGEPADTAAAFYFELDGEPIVLACDRWSRVPDNIAAIAAHIEALRGQERWGVADLKQAFAGHVALPAPDRWDKVLGLSRTATINEVEEAYRKLAKRAHADQGSDTEMLRLNVARDEARGELK